MQRSRMQKNSDWDLDLRDGEAGESKLADLLHIDTIEVKTDRRWKDTGNLFIEEACFQQSTRMWAPSGITISKATHWAFVLDDSVLIVSKNLLLDVIEEYGKPAENKQMPNPSRGWLITPQQLINYPRVLNEEFNMAVATYKSVREQEYPV